jgi:multidrug efflux pump subunit AcrA (membrane-fusion protein)
VTTPPTPPTPPGAPLTATRPGLFAAPPTRRGPTRKVLAAAGAVVVLVGGFAVHAAAGPSGASGYRTALVGTSDVDQTLQGVGSVEPVTQAAVAFPVAGTVASVGVSVGDVVAVGQSLATLDGASLQVAIDTQQAAVDQADLVLEKAKTGSSGSGSSSGASSGAGSTASSSATGTSASRTTGGATASADAAVIAAQQDVVNGQQAVDSRLQDAQQALDSADRICAATSTATSASTTSTTVIGDEPDPTAPGGTPAAAADAAPDTSVIEACRTALQGVLDAQQLVSDAQTSLGKAATTYDQLLDQRAQQLTTASQTSSASTSGSGSGTGGSSPSGSTSVSSADLIKDQKAVDAAVAQLAVAQQALKQATVVSPIAGTVAAVGLTPGAAVTAGSTTATIVVVGAGGVEVTTTVAVDRLPAVDLGQTATVVPDGASKAITGKVVAIGAPTTSSTGATTYPVTIGLPASTTGLRNGSVASVSIITKEASHALVVPTSAVHTAGTAHTVDVVSGGTPKSVPVKVGAVGTTWTEITSGLTAGQEVVLATLDQPLPTSATQVSSTGTNQGQVRFPGGAFPGGRAGTGGTAG